ncbi:replication restart DNA helicase PriA [Mumia flava]|uniref:Probable replication restart protein PriA n=1 Tax=Mumia flava TaxID=1348852 RepID=A0A0B2B6R2_9ACTN|nr:primosomal protein N' [Mumia flava]PJJ55838.1 replication restart DNA helicase PriA [Mumia flava]
MTDPDAEPTQLALVPSADVGDAGGQGPPAGGAADGGPASASADRFAGAAQRLPVARVAIEVSLAHLDRPFDYLVPEAMDDQVVAGCRVMVRFGGASVSGFVLERSDTTEHTGRLGRISRVVSSEPVLRPDVARACRAVADRYAGTFADVVRLAVPPRHARTEKRPLEGEEPLPVPAERSTVWAAYDGGTDVLDALATGGSPRAVWSPRPGAAPEAGLVEAVAAVLSGGRGAIVCLPDVADVERLDAAMTAAWGSDHHVTLTADLGPAARYAAFLRVLRGRARVVIGTRAAAFAPVADLGLVAIWDDGDDLFAEPRAPYPHTREVLLTRAWDSGCGVLVAGWARTPEAQQLVESGWCSSIEAPSAQRRAAWPRIETDEPGRALSTARLPAAAFRAVRAGLEAGPVLVQVPRTGYRASLACQECRRPARCVRCTGPLRQDDPGAPPRCGWCGGEAEPWSCPHCGGTRLRAPLLGDRRTVEELGRAFPQVRVRSSVGGSAVRDVDAEPAIVVATPGAEPRASGGYAAAVLLDTWATLSRPDLRTDEEALRRWLNAAALVRGSADGGRLVVVGDPGVPVVQALVRTDPVGFAARELGERRAARLPPAARLATLEGPEDAVTDLVGHGWPEHAQVLGPIELDADDDGPRARLVVAVPRSGGRVLTAALRHVQADRSLRKRRPVRVQVDPYALG